MCTAATYKTKDFYFGRTLDYEFSYGDEIIITPRKYMFNFKYMGKVNSHYAIIGMAHEASGYPLYYDAMNENGLCMAGLNFVGNASYYEFKKGHENIAQFEFIPWILGSCSNITEVKRKLEVINITADSFSPQLPCASLHWIIADKNSAITVECMKDGMHIFDNKVGVLTNNPPFDMQMMMLNNYAGLSPKQPVNSLGGIEMNLYSRGMGAIGLPGDLSSASRFARAAFTKLNSVSGDGEAESVSQFFHILGSVEQQRGCCEVRDGKYEITLYTSCCNADRGIYYYKTYDNSRISAVNMNKEELNSENLIKYAVITTQSIYYQNGF